MPLLLLLVLIFIVATPVRIPNNELCSLDPQVAKVINSSLQTFRQLGGINKDMIAKAAEYSHTCLVVIKNKKLKSKCLKFGLNCFIRSIARYLPDMDFVVNLSDQPRVFKGNCTKDQDWRYCACDKNYTLSKHGIFLERGAWKPENQKVPVFSPTSIPECFIDIIMPSHLHLKQRFVTKDKAWSQRVGKVFWRGETTGGDFTRQTPHFSQFHRQKLVAYCQSTKLCDAGFSNYVQCSEEICNEMRKAYGPQNILPSLDQLKFKYAIDIDENTYSGRFPLALQSGSAVFKMATFVDFAYLLATPWEHYIPVNIDLSDFQKTLSWAQHHDSQVQKIAKQGQEFSLKNYNVHNFRCSMYHLLLQYHSLLTDRKIVWEGELEKERQL